MELVWRYSKSELAFESLRVVDWEARRKLLLLATLAYAFLLQLLGRSWEDLRASAAELVPSQREALSGGGGAALPIAVGAQSTLANGTTTGSPSTRVKFGMTHALCCSDGFYF